jgi:hypothetical protein
MTTIVYTNCLKELLSGTIDLTVDPIYVMLLSGSYVPNTAHVNVGDVLAHQVVDSLGSYVSGGKRLTGPVIASSSNYAYFDAADMSWPTTTLTCSGAVLYHSGGTSNAARKLISWVELGTTVTTNGTIQIGWNSTYGVFKLNGG